MKIHFGVAPLARIFPLPTLLVKVKFADALPLAPSGCDGMFPRVVALLAEALPEITAPAAAPDTLFRVKCRLYGNAFDPVREVTSPWTVYVIFPSSLPVRASSTRKMPVAFAHAWKRLISHAFRTREHEVVACGLALKLFTRATRSPLARAFVRASWTTSALAPTGCVTDVVTVVVTGLLLCGTALADPVREPAAVAAMAAPAAARRMSLERVLCVLCKACFPLRSNSQSALMTVRCGFRT
ncbi:hypothetical protein J2Z21_008905 [Streptomyces griseochromogenes]|uniref:Secreted protein n=1 Tax=Streptomyces griseochromogenes TaxID=68214 RepID=A0ABS4M885_9ACTN|nr:hypothetical protein [Streptomyces griseochromogenes]MBP2055889.1 hypothetical protein [Streptomyces griseochromogenes]